MDVVIAEEAQPYRPMRQWALRCEREPLLATWRTAARRAAELGRGVLASYEQPVGWCDALAIFAGARIVGLEAKFFWERPAEQTALVGIGTATTVTTTGSARFTAAAATWKRLLADAIIRRKAGREPHERRGPLLFGGFAFDPLGPHAPTWQGFPDGLLILPQILVSVSASGAALTVNQLIQPGSAVERDVATIVADVMRLGAAAQEVALPLAQENGLLVITETPGAATWMERVAEVVGLIRQGAYEKVVLARSARVRKAAPMEPFEVGVVLQRLRRSYPGTSVFALQRGECCFVGATPERLASIRDGQIHTMALAGSAPRGASAAEDQRIGQELLRSAKNQGEHAIVAAMVREALASLCTKVWVAEQAQLLRLQNVQHLELSFAGELLPGRSLLNAVACLHPTPAVGGFPREAALAAIRRNEQLDRGWYAGPIGWIGADGAGEFAVALRSALIAGAEATLFAGCGIVADSDPQSEYAESQLKLRAMLRGLGGEG
jgi:isochorismate synthase